MTFEFKPFPNWGYATRKLTEKNLQPITDEVEAILADNSNAVFFAQGGTEEAYQLSDKVCKHLEYLLIKTTRDYSNHMPAYKKDMPPLKCINANLVIQKPGETIVQQRPLGYFHFCLFYRIPYTIANEQRYDADRSGMMELSYTDVTGTIIHMTVPADSSYNGTLILLPWNVSTITYPFRSTTENKLVITGALRAPSQLDK